jgi:spermidine synthase
VAQPLVVELLVRLHGDELEIDASLAGEHPILPHSTFVHPDGWWPAFKARELDGSTLGGVYRDLLYPAVAEIVGRRPGHVLDLGGGDGELAAALLGAGAATNVTVVDRNQALLAAARGRLTEGATVVDADLAAKGWPASLEGPFDAIVAVGLFESNVLPTAVARHVLEAARLRLAPGGALVITGTGAALVRRAQLEALALDVTNATLPAGEVRGATYPLYVARSASRT